MATYIQGVTDYIPQIQPFKPDYNFLGNMLQARQTKYDTNYKQLSEQYGTLLNSPMLKDVHNKQRDEFFKIVNQDIKKISTMDLSLQKNSDAATKVFDSFYKNKFLVDDMVKTKKYQDELQKGEAYKYCDDPDKCNGKYWQDGIDYLHYKAQEYRNSTDEEGMRMEMPSYVPESNWKEKALKFAKENNYDVSQDTLSGDWIVHDQNGKLVEQGLRGLFSEIYGDDGLVQQNYDIKSYLSRQRYIEQKGPTLGKEAAEREWIDYALNSGTTVVDKERDKTNDSFTQLSTKLNKLINKANTQGLTPDEIELVERLTEEKKKLKSLNDNIDVVKNSITPKDKDLRSLRGSAEKAYAQLLLNNDIINLAHIASLRNMEHKLTVNPLAQQRIAHQYALEQISAELQAKMTYKEYEMMLESGMLNNTSLQNKSIKLPAETYNSADIDLEEHPELYYQMNTQELAETTQKAQSTSADFLYGMYKTAMLAAKNPNMNPGAVKYLKEVFGEDYSTIATKEDIINRLSKQKVNLYDKIKYTVNFMDADSKDNDWGSVYMSNNRDALTDIEMDDRAQKAVLKSHLAVNEKIANSVKSKLSKQDRIYEDADLLLSPNGVAMIQEEMPVEFLYKWAQRRKGKGNAPLSRKEREFAEEVYKANRDAFLEIYKKSPDVSTSQAFNIAPGGSKITGTPVRMDDIDPARYADTRLTSAREYVDLAVTDGGKMKFVFGDPDVDNINDVTEEDQKLIQKFLTTTFKQDITTNWLKEKNKEKDKDVADSNYGKRPVFTMVKMPIAGENKDLRAVKFILNPLYYENKIGSKNAPRELWSVKNKIGDGITMIYNATEVDSPMDRDYRSSSFEKVVRNEGMEYYDPDYGKIKLSFDKNKNIYIKESSNLVRFDKYGREIKSGVEYSEIAPGVKLTIDDHIQIQNTIKQGAAATRAMREKIRTAYKNQK
jgi:hypothetical protein